MHRQLLATADDRFVDHENRNRLDNRRKNLRVVSRAENNQNLTPRRGCSSPHRGVSWHRSSQKWRAYATLNGKQHALGLFVDEAEAARTAREFRLSHLSHATD